MDYKEYNDYELLYMVKENSEIMGVIIDKYEPIIKKIACSVKNKYYRYNFDIEDLVQEGRIGLLKACNFFSEKKNVIFFTFAILCIKRNINNYIRNYFTYREKTNIYADHYDIDELESMSVTYSHPLDMSLDYEIVCVLKSFSYELDFIDSCVFILKSNNFSYKEISILLDISLKMVDNKLFKINKKLKNYLLKSNYCL